MWGKPHISTPIKAQNIHIFDQEMIGFDLRDITAGKADDQIARLGPATFEGSDKGIPTNRIINHVDAAQSFDLGHDIFLCAVNSDGRASVFAHL